MIRIIIAALACVALASPAQAQQQIIYGPDGRVVGRSSVDSAGTKTTYGADGKVISRESTSGNQTTIYDDKGRTVGRYTTSPQR